MSERTKVEVKDDVSENRYEAWTDAGEMAGFAEYELSEGVIAFVHTVVGDDFGGQGIGSSLVRASLDDVRDRGGLRVRATCPFYAKWIAKHPDYQDLLVD